MEKISVKFRFGFINIHKSTIRRSITYWHVIDVYFHHLFFCVMFCGSLFVLLQSFDLSVICPSICAFWYLRTVLTLTCLKGVMFSVQEHKQHFNITILCYTTNYGLCEFDITDIMHEHI